MSKGDHIDCRGLSCPHPVTKTKKALDRIKAGSTLTVIVDNETSRDNVKRLAQKCDYPVVVKENEGEFYLKITKSERTQQDLLAEPAQITEAEPLLPERLGYSVFITSNLLGTGEEELGGILMKAFLNTIWDTKPKPDKIIFMNSGIRLTTEGSDVLESLHLLSESGVQILSCGTCLAYYKLTEKLKVGIASNMYEIVNTLLDSVKILKI